MNDEINQESAVSDLSPYQLFTLDVRKRNQEFFKELSPIEINKRIAFQWTLMSQLERRSYYERCGIHIDKSIASKIRKLNKDSNSSNESMNSDDNRELIHEHINNHNTANDDDTQRGRRSTKEFIGSDDDVEYSTPKRRKGRRRKGFKRNNFDLHSNADNEDNYVPPRRGRGGRRRK